MYSTRTRKLHLGRHDRRPAKRGVLSGISLFAWSQVPQRVPVGDNCEACTRRTAIGALGPSTHSPASVGVAEARGNRRERAVEAH